MTIVTFNPIKDSCVRHMTTDLQRPYSLSLSLSLHLSSLLLRNMNGKFPLQNIIIACTLRVQLIYALFDHQF